MPYYPTMRNRTHWPLKEQYAYYTSAPHHCSDPKCPGTLNARRLELLERAVDALHELMDVQNGPPLVAEAEEWDRAMVRARAIVADASAIEEAAK